MRVCVSNKLDFKENKRKIEAKSVPFECNTAYRCTFFFFRQ